MDLRYVLKENCPRCGKKTRFGIRFCPFCGQYAGNDGPRFRLRAAQEVHEMYAGQGAGENPPGSGQEKDITGTGPARMASAAEGIAKMAAPIGSIFGKARTAVFDVMEQGEAAADPEIQPFFFHIRGMECSILEMKGFLEIDGENAAFSRDARGAYFECRSPEGYLFNGEKPAARKKYYLRNGDTLAAGGRTNGRLPEVYAYSVMNQKETVWHRTEISEGLSETLSCSRVRGDAQGLVHVSPGTPEAPVLLNNRDLTAETVLRVFDRVETDGRNFILMPEGLMAQEALSPEEKKSLALFVNHIAKDEQLDVNIRERTAAVPGVGTRRLLRDIRLTVRTGEMVLILGGSGAGKTTFINAVMGNEKADAEIRLGSFDLYKDFDKIKRMIGSVPQFDLLRPNDTVHMTLKNAAQMKLPREFTSDERLLEGRIMEVLRKLSLEKEDGTLVSKLSGGQRKRLSVATEYISDPAMFILDEPDSGLDGYQSRLLMQNLRAIADDDKIVMVISHAPDRTPELYDKVIVLAKSTAENCGQLAFYGSVPEALDFFETDSLEMVVGRVEQDPDKYIEKYRHSKLPIEEGQK